MGVVLVWQGLRQGWSAEGQSSLGLGPPRPKAPTGALEASGSQGESLDFDIERKCKDRWPTPPINSGEAQSPTWELEKGPRILGHPPPSCSSMNRSVSPPP